MRIKKFSCLNCGAPKVNKYISPYVVCDYCGALTDIDFTVGMDTWNELLFTTVVYQLRKATLMQQSQAALMSGNRDEYFRLQYAFWDLYYQTFPPFLPPSIDTPEKYKPYLEICAISSVEAAFDPKWQVYARNQQQLQQSVTFHSTPEGQRAHSEPFFALAQFFIEMTREGMQVFYRDPRYAIMHELLPERVHLKLKLSMFVQAWLPYLTRQDAEMLLDISGFKLDYVEIAEPVGKITKCSHCRNDLFAPDGAYKVFCESCRKMTRLAESFFCMSCGSPNAVPDNPGKPISCMSCKVENRLIRPQFG